MRSTLSAAAIIEVLATQLANLGFDLCGDLMRAARGLVRAISQGGEPTGFIADDPGMHGLSRDTEALGYLGDLPPILHDRENRLTALLHDAELHQHEGPLPLDPDRARG